MKFLYVDESGGRDQSDVFVMAGLLSGAMRLSPTEFLREKDDRHAD